MNTFRFAYPFILVGLVLPVLVFGVPALRQLRFRAASMRYSDVRLMSGLQSGWRVRLRWLPDGLRWLAWIVLLIALARPQTGNALEVVRGQGIDIVLALDISNSMAALDFEPQNRLEAAKTVIADFIAGREFDRIGLVIFSRNAFQQAPLTLDYDVLLELLDDVRLVDDIVGPSGARLVLDGTAIGLGIASAANMLRDSTAASQVIVLVTDGANNAALDPVQAATAADAFDIRIYTIGMGRTGLVNIPDRDGNIIAFESDLDEATLQSIAQSANGQYFRAEDLVDLQQVYDQIDVLERSEVERIVVTRWQDQAWGLLWMGLILLIAERVLRRTVFQSVP